MVVIMSAPHPHSVADLSLAPVLIELERNLVSLRANEDVEFGLALQLNDIDSMYHSAAERAGRVLQCVTRGVDLHGWTVEPTGDLYGLSVRHGEYEVSLMLGKRLVSYVEGTAQEQEAR
jgi:hypothetical protein